MDISRRNLLKMLGIAGGAAVVGAAAGGYASSGGALQAGQEEWRSGFYREVVRRTPPSSTTVYWADPNSAGSGKSWPEKVAHVFNAAGHEDIVDRGDNIAIKLHTGERNRTAQLRPDMVRAAANMIREAGGEPYVADTLTAYGGKTTTRASIKNHMLSAITHGLTDSATGCPVIPYTDGDGSDHYPIKIDGNQLTVALVAKLLAEGDAMLVLTHTKGHGCGMMGAAVKNLGIGGGSKQGKVLDHDRYVGRYDTGRVFQMDVAGCPGKSACPVYGDNIVQECIDWCPWGAMSFDAAGKLVHDPEVCRTTCRNSLADVCTTITRYGCTVKMTDATELKPSSRVQAANCEIRYADTAVAVHNCFDEGKVGYISVMKEVCRQCDCVGYDDMPIVPHLGVTSSWDMASVDACFIDMTQASEPMPNSKATEKGLRAGDEKWEPINGQSPWFQVYAVEKLGYGTTNYALETVDEPWLFPWFLTPLHSWDYSSAYRTLIPKPPDKPYTDPTSWYHDE